MQDHERGLPLVCPERVPSSTEGACEEQAGRSIRGAGAAGWAAASASSAGNQLPQPAPRSSPNGLPAFLGQKLTHFPQRPRLWLSPEDKTQAGL